MHGRNSRLNQPWNPGTNPTRQRYADNEPSSSVNPVSFAQAMYRGPPGFHSNVSSMRGPFGDSFSLHGSQADANIIFQAAESSYQAARNAGVEAFPDVTGTGVRMQGEYPVHQLVADADRVLSGNRVISPVVDSTVGQSGLGQSLRRHIPSSNGGNIPHSSSILHNVSSSQSYLQPPSMPTFSQSEVTTTGGSLGLIGQGHSSRNVNQVHADEMEAAVSSMNNAEEEFVSSPNKKQDKKQSPSGDEPDTTHNDDEDYQPTERDYLTEDSDNEGPNEGEDMRVMSAPGPSRPAPSIYVPRQPQANLSMRSVKINAAPASGLIGPELLAASHVPVSGFPLGLGMDQGRSSCQFVDSVPASGHMIQSHMLPPHLQMQQLGSSHLPQPSNQSSNLLPHINLVVDSTMFGGAPTSTSTMEDRPIDMVQNYMVPQDQEGLDTSTVTQSQPESTNTRTSITPPGQDDDSYDDVHTDLSYPRRKSNRLRELDGPTIRKPKYHDKPYNPEALWCEECYDTFDVECPVHKLTALPDKVVFSRAWASLPLALQIFRLGGSDKDNENEDDVELGVFAKRTIQKFTQFGPFVAEMVDHRSKLSQDKFILTVRSQEAPKFDQVERPDGEIVHYETTDENKCNWMMFVRPAKTFSEQNMVAYQHGQDIYFTVTRTIDVKGELKVWYASHYAERWGFPRLEITEEDMQAIEEQISKFQCYECPKRFKTASALQKHLLTHDDPRPSSSAENGGEGEIIKKRKFLQSHSLLRKKHAAKKIKDITNAEGQVIPGNGAANAVYHWKKRSTNIYLNKTLKKYQLRHDAEALRRNIQSMYRKGEDESSNEWVCNSCDLTFDNANLLNLHTLTHAAEDVGLEEIRKFAFQGDQLDLGTSDLGTGLDLGNIVSGNIVSLGQPFLACPVCQTQFDNKKDLIEHAAEHGRSKESRLTNYNRPHKCDMCWKSFATTERLQKHQLVHGDEESKPLQCIVCFKRFMNNSALACHMKTHSTGKYYECPVCGEGFDQTAALREHSLIHASADGLFDCAQCDKRFSEFLVLKKHVRANHTNQIHPCPDCNKVFPRIDKLRLHMLRHSTVREFMCDSCGRQFKRKDKLKEHIKRMHSDERKERDRLKAMKPSNSKRFIPKVLPSEYHRFIYKCQLCMLGFKRRGMLVNHIAKRHPDVKPTSIPELNLPILKTQRDYYCQYCDKVYKSSSKRKAHILKNHPGAELPMSSRKKNGVEEIPGIPNPTYSQTVGSITTMPQQCEYCHKQYASKAKLLQHQRKKHSDIVPQLPDRPKRGSELMAQIQQEVAASSGEAPTIQVMEGETSAADTVQAADLLTQAMSELTQSLKEYQQTVSSAGGTEATFLSARLATAPTMVQIATPGTSQASSTIELSQLNQALQQFAPGAGGTVSNIQVQVSGASSPIQIPILTTSQAGEAVSTAQIVAVDALASTATTGSSTPPTVESEGEATPTTQTITFPINIVPASSYVTKSWTNYTYKSE